MTGDVSSMDERAAGSLHRIAAALERLAPPPPASADPLTAPAYIWRAGVLATARAFAPLDLDLLVGVEAQKAVLLDNIRRLGAGHGAHDVLLWGARGAGKSALVKAAVGAAQAGGANVALVEVSGDRITTLPALFALLADVPRAFVLFVDDLGFDGDAGAPRLLRSLLEGGAEARPPNVRLHVTANRRHIVARDIAEQESAISARDVIDDRLALADRFGLSLGFHVADQEQYLAMVAGYAAKSGLVFDRQEAIAWATVRGGRSGRVAWQYAVELAGRAGRTI